MFRKGSAKVIPVREYKGGDEHEWRDIIVRRVMQRVEEEAEERRSARRGEDVNVLDVEDYLAEEQRGEGDSPEEDDAARSSHDVREEREQRVLEDLEEDIAITDEDDRAAATFLNWVTYTKGICLDHNELEEEKFD